MDNDRLPPLPPSDRESLDRNKFDGYYEVRARDFWGENRLLHIEETENVICKHEFRLATGGVKCQKCHFGLIGQIDVQDGKLFYQGEPIGL